jgi:hypothetical protein
MASHTFDVASQPDGPPASRLSADSMGSGSSYLGSADTLFAPCAAAGLAQPLAYPFLLDDELGGPALDGPALGFGAKTEGGHAAAPMQRMQQLHGGAAPMQHMQQLHGTAAHKYMVPLQPAMDGAQLMQPLPVPCSNGGATATNTFSLSLFGFPEADHHQLQLPHSLEGQQPWAGGLGEGAFPGLSIQLPAQQQPQPQQQQQHHQHQHQQEKHGQEQRQQAVNNKRTHQAPHAHEQQQQQQEPKRHMYQLVRLDAATGQLLRAATEEDAQEAARLIESSSSGAGAISAAAFGAALSRALSFVDYAPPMGSFGCLEAAAGGGVVNGCQRDQNPSAILPHGASGQDERDELLQRQQQEDQEEERASAAAQQRKSVGAGRPAAEKRTGPCDHCLVRDSPQWCVVCGFGSGRELWRHNVVTAVLISRILFTLSAATQSSNASAKNRRKGPSSAPVLCNACGTAFRRNGKLPKREGAMTAAQRRRAAVAAAPMR